MAAVENQTPTRKLAILRILALNSKRALSAREISHIGRFPVNTTTTNYLAELRFAGFVVRTEGKNTEGRPCAYYTITLKGAKEAVEPAPPIPRMTPFMQGVLQVFVDRPDQEMYGAEICRINKALKGSSIYTTLRRLEDEGWLICKSENVDQHATRRPARYYYKITPRGLEEARRALAESGGRIPCRLMDEYQ